MRTRFRRSVSAAAVAVLLSAVPLAAQTRSVVVPAPVVSPFGRTLAPARYSADFSGNAIRRSALDGSSSVVIVADVHGPYGLAFDPAGRNLVWTSATDEVVQLAPTSGGRAVTLESSFEEGYAIEFTEGNRDVVYGLVDTHVVRLGQDRQTGQETQEVLLELAPGDLVHGLALSPDHTVLYLGDEVGQMSRKLTLATGQLETLVYESMPLPGPAELALEPVR